MMPTLVRTFVIVALAFGIASASLPSLAQERGPVRITSGMQYEFLDRWDVDRLNRILQVDTPKFAGVSATYSPARNAVRLYRVTYSSVVPERGNKPIVATGLIAIPETTGTNFPMVSYQHGTVYGSRRCLRSPSSLPRRRS
jgi:hypothetical protein